MKSIAKLKDRARKHEQKEDWKAAIEAYQEVLEAQQGEDESELELGLFNRVGDLYLRLGQTDDAVSYYEEAADKYAEAGFFNNAIALCNKALRHRPERPQIYLKLSRLCAEQGFGTDARRWILDYAEREVKLGQVDAALQGLSEFVETSGDPDVREFLGKQLATHGREDEAVEQYVKSYARRMQRGETAAAERAAQQARAIDPSVDLETAAAAAQVSAPAAPGPDDGIGGAAIGDDLAAPSGLAGLETRPEPSAPSDGIGGIEGLEGLEPTGVSGEAPEGTAGGDLSGLEVSYSEREPEASPEEIEDSGNLGGLETFGALELGGQDAEEPGAGVAPVAGGGGDDDEPEPLPLMEIGLDEETEAPDPLPLLDMGPEAGDEEGEELEPLPMMDFGDADDEAAEEPAAAEEAAVGDLAAAGDGMDLDLGSFDLGMGPSEPSAAGTAEPEAESADVVDDGVEEAAAVDVDAVLERSRELVSRGLTAESLTELSLLSDASAPPEVFGQALGVLNEIIRHDANDLAALRRRVEYSERTEDQELLVNAYLDLAEALNRTGAETKAQAMYQRVLDLDPDHEVARQALGITAEPADEEAIDLDAILREMDPGEMAGVTADEGPVPDQSADPAFAAMLSQFKARVNEQVETEDAGDHYDLGLAFKEMGLIDEAIAEFQTALTGGEERLKVYEELGQCFIQKGQFNVALKVLNRALQVPHQEESELLGVYYHLGQCQEELGQREKARESYERVLAIDPSFQDVPDRMARL